MRRADVPYEVKSTFDAAGLFVGASISCVPTWLPFGPEASNTDALLSVRL
jgi:hypothetical protein